MKSKIFAITLLFAISLLLFVFNIYADDNPSNSVKGTVICIDKDGKECDMSKESSPACCPKKCDNTLGLKTSDGKIFPFAADAKKRQSLKLNDYVGKNVEVSGYVCPISKSVHSTAVKLAVVEKKGCCSKAKKSTQ